MWNRQSLDQIWTKLQRLTGGTKVEEVQEWGARYGTMNAGMYCPLCLE